MTAISPPVTMATSQTCVGLRLAVISHFLSSLGFHVVSGTALLIPV